MRLYGFTFPLRFIFYGIALVLMILTIIGLLIYKNFVGNGLFVKADRQSMVVSMHQLNRLETASFTMEKIIEAGNDENANVFKQFLFGDNLLLIANADIVAGFDLSKVSTKDIVIDKKDVTINLPAPEILITKLNNDKTKVYNRTTGLLTKGNKDLESEARTKAEEAIRKDACDAGIMKMAVGNGGKQITALFLGMGFEKVTVNIPPYECK
jgi:hypothetical protein